jgi:hypothetical protein
LALPAWSEEEKDMVVSFYEGNEKDELSMLV